MTCSRSSHTEEHFGPEWRAKPFRLQDVCTRRQKSNNPMSPHRSSPGPPPSPKWQARTAL